MTNPRPIQTHCAKGHPRKQVSTTGAWYCPTCNAQNARKDEKCVGQCYAELESGVECSRHGRPVT